MASGGLGLLPSTAPAGYDVNTRPFAIAGELVCGSPRNHAHLPLPVFASTANTVHDSVLNTHVPSAHALDDGPSSLSAKPQLDCPVCASSA